MKGDKEKKYLSGDDIIDQINIADTFESEDDFLGELSESLKQQITEEFAKEEGTSFIDGGNDMGHKNSKGKKKYKALKITGAILGVLTLILVFLVGTAPGRQFLINMGAGYLSSRLDNVDTETNDSDELFSEVEPDIDPETGEKTDIRRESYVANFLLFGIEEIGGGGRTDSMMIASVNKKDKTIKLTSLMRDSYVSIPGHKNNKLNAAYSFGGADLLIQTIEQNFKIKIDGYASVNFDSFEKIIDLLDGVDIELGKEEARYLRNTNYISDPKYRTVQEGWNTLNGNQALGYARVRKVETLGGANNDFGRTLRQRRLLNAMFDKYKSKSLVELFTIMNDILPMIKTNVNTDTISKLLTVVVENGITTIENNCLPAKGMYSAERNECGAVLVLDFEANIKELYRIIFLDEPEVTPEVTP